MDIPERDNRECSVLAGKNSSPVEGGCRGSARPDADGGPPWWPTGAYTRLKGAREGVRREFLEVLWAVGGIPNVCEG